MVKTKNNQFLDIKKAKTKDNIEIKGSNKII